MKQNDFYEVNDCMSFIPVTINETHDEGVVVTVSNAKRNCTLVVEEVYMFPKAHEPKKPVIPKYVAEWVERQRKFGHESAFISMTRLRRNAPEKVKFWFDNNPDTYVRAWLDGYEIEKEKLYFVEIPDPHGMFKIRYLYRCGNGNICMGGSDYDYKDIFSTKETHLTEAEIKQDFEWAWQFAKEVEE